MGAIAALLWRLGGSSLFVDEVYSWRAATVGLSELLERVRLDEVAPPTYYIGLHEWIGRAGTDGEWFMRLPSALAAAALVVAVYRLAKLVEGRSAGLLAAALTAASPLVLQYGQQVRAYIWAMLAVTLSAIAAVEAHRAGSSSTRARWASLCVVTAVASVWLHYVALLVILPVLAWISTRRWLPAAVRRVLIIAFGLAVAPLLPLMIDQLGRGHAAGVAPAARLSYENVVRWLGTPFDGRYAGSVALPTLGAAVTAVALVIVTRLAWRTPGPRRLVLALALVPLSVVLTITIAGQPILITRYTTVAAPFLLAVVAMAASSSRRSVGVPLAVVTLATATAGNFASQSREGFYPDTRAAVAAAASGWAPGDLLVADGYAAIGPALEYYAGRSLPRGAAIVNATDRRTVSRAISRGSRLWLLTSTPSTPRALNGFLGTFDYRLASVASFTGNLQLVLAVPG